MEPLSRRKTRIEHTLRTATARAARSSPVIHELFATAKVSAQTEPRPQVVVTFTATPFQGGLHQIYEAEYIDSETDRELARILSWCLRDSVRQKLRKQPPAPNSR